MSGVISWTNKHKNPILKSSQVFHASKITSYTVIYKPPLCAFDKD